MLMTALSASGPDERAAREVIAAVLASPWAFAEMQWRIGADGASGGAGLATLALLVKDLGRPDAAAGMMARAAAAAPGSAVYALELVHILEACGRPQAALDACLAFCRAQAPPPARAAARPRAS
jgi:hypothetical protein